eukprot:scpid8485/ scgid5278/ Sushi, von Willebrand factor type A, EGF and pentraxin domain-containing protein 1; CCP module-containing protein 22; Polydom; Selectin-like osteoblast-derived protein; Serologically defined breast cancer antigen NY-BR-38
MASSTNIIKSCRRIASAPWTMCVLALLLCGAWLAESTWVQCPSTQHQYQYVNVSMKFANSQLYCRDNLTDGRLATPTNAVENTCISQVKPAVSVRIGVLVVGNMSINAQTGIFTVYSNWGPGQPDGTAVTRCVSIVGTGVGTGDKWADGSCESTKGFVCQRTVCASRPKTIANGVITAYGTAYPNNITYQCNPGYFISGLGNQSVTGRSVFCKLDGSWSTIVISTCNPVTCPWRGTTLANGNITTYSRSYSEGIVYNCSAGFYIDGASSDTITSRFSKCQANRTWSSPAPTCTAVRCNKPPAAKANSGRAVTTRRYPGSVTYSCTGSTRYVDHIAPITQITLTCLPNKSWIGDAPSCLPPVSCPNRVKTLLNGNITAFSLVYPKSIVYNCSAGFYVGGQPSEKVTSRVSKCQVDGAWSTPIPTCVGIQCKTPPAARAFSVAQAGGRAYPGAAVYQCFNGYYVGGQTDQSIFSVTLMCSTAGDWQGSSPKCQRKTCPMLPTPMSATLTYSNKLLYQSVAMIKCTQGYKIKGQPLNSVNVHNRTCRADNTWSFAQPVCTGVICPPLNNQLPNLLRIDNNNTRAYGNTSTYICNTGYHIAQSKSYLVSTYVVECLYTGKWNASAPTCSPVRCIQPPSVIANGLVSGTEVTYNKTYSFNCQRGFHISGSPATTTSLIIQCGSDAKWTSLFPTCAAVMCRAIPSSIANGTVSAQGTSSSFSSFGSIVNYVCMSGFQIFGAVPTLSRALTCKLDGRWNNTVPVCSGVPICPPLSKISNGKFLATDGQKIGSVATYVCQIGYQLRGTSKRTCQTNTLWTSSAPVCNNINECVLGVDTCNQVNGTCKDTRGSYSCSCNPGYAGDGRKCTVVCKDQCIAGQGYCTAPDHCDCIGEYSGLSCQNLWPAVTRVRTASLSSVSALSTVSRLSNFSAADGDYHPGRCAVQCYRRGFVFAGMHTGIVCYCSSSNPGILSVATGPAIQCAGAPAFSCGGSNTISFYQLKEVPPTQVTISAVGGTTVSVSGEIFVLLRSSLDMECKVAAGTSPITYTWQHVGATRSRQKLLQISPTMVTDSGPVTCIVSNPRVTSSPNFTLPTQASAFVRVHVQTPPVAALSALDLYLVESETLNINCTAKSNPQATFAWKRYDPITDIATSLQASAIVDAKSGNLLIEKVSKSDEGSYRCRATDSTIVFPSDQRSDVVMKLTVTVGAPCGGPCIVNNSHCDTQAGECYCLQGFTGNAYVSCSDINECMSTPCSSDTVCVNEVAAYTCVPRCEFDRSAAGCDPGGPDDQSGSESDGAVGAAVGGAVGGILVLAVVIAILVLYLKRQKKDKRMLSRNSSKLVLVNGRGQKESQSQDANDYEVPEATNGPGREKRISRNMFQTADSSFGKSPWTGAIYCEAGGEASVALFPTVNADDLVDNPYDTMTRDLSRHAAEEGTYDVLQRAEPVKHTAAFPKGRPSARPHGDTGELTDLYDTLEARDAATTGGDPSFQARKKDKEAASDDGTHAQYNTLAPRSTTVSGGPQPINPVPSGRPQVDRQRHSTTTIGQRIAKRPAASTDSRTLPHRPRAKIPPNSTASVTVPDSGASAYEVNDLDTTENSVRPPLASVSGRPLPPPGTCAYEVNDLETTENSVRPPLASVSGRPLPPPGTLSKSPPEQPRATDNYEVTELEESTETVQHDEVGSTVQKPHSDESKNGDSGHGADHDDTTDYNYATPESINQLSKANAAKLAASSLQGAEVESEYDCPDSFMPAAAPAAAQSTSGLARPYVNEPSPKKRTTKLPDLPDDSKPVTELSGEPAGIHESNSASELQQSNERDLYSVADMSRKASVRQDMSAEKPSPEEHDVYARPDMTRKTSVRRPAKAIESSSTGEKDIYAAPNMARKTSVRRPAKDQTAAAAA